MALVNVVLQGTGQLEQVDGLLVFVQNYDVGFLDSDTELGGNGPSPRCRVAWQVTLDCELVVTGVHNIVDDAIMSPGVSASVK